MYAVFSSYVHLSFSFNVDRKVATYKINLIINAFMIYEFVH